MMTDSQKSFVKIKLWFSQLVNKNQSEQKAQIDQLQIDGTLDEAEIKLLKDMLHADKETGMATNIESISEDIVNQAGQKDTSLKDKQVGPYKIISSLGEGGMGHVYLAQRNDGLFEQKVALKLPHSSFNAQMLLRFENERQILAQLTHNNIAHLLDGGTTENNQPYIAMEYIQGKNIDKYCTEKIPGLNQRLDLILQICSAVTFSHQQLVLHRDLKPSNILVTESGQVKLLDFGIAKLLDLDEEAKAKDTATQIMTRYYASPEQLKGKPASTHSDLFSLAIIAYELITGYHPFQHKDQHEREQNLISGKIMRVTQRTDEREALLPELAKISSGKLQGDLENILLKALSVDPIKRYESVKEFADDLNNFIENKPVSARKPSLSYSLKKWFQRNKAFAILATFTIFSLLAATFYSIQKATIAENQKLLAQTQTKRALKISDFLQNIFLKARPLSGKKELTAKALLQAGIENVQDELHDDPENLYRILFIILNSYKSLSEYHKVLEIFEEIYPRCVSDLGATHDNCQDLLILAARAQRKVNGNEKNLEYLLKAEDIARNQETINQDKLAKILRSKFIPLINLNRLDEAFESSEEALKLLEEIQTNPLNIADVYNDLAIVATTNKKFEKALSYIKSMDDIYQKHGPNRYHDLSVLEMVKGHYYAEQRLYKKAIEHRQKSVDLLKNNFEEVSETLGWAMFGLAKLYYLDGQELQSIEIAKKTLKIYRSIDGYSLIRENQLLAFIANILFQLKDYSQGLEYHKQIKVMDEYVHYCAYLQSTAHLFSYTKQATEAHPKIDAFEHCILERYPENELLKATLSVFKTQTNINTKNFQKATTTIMDATNYWTINPTEATLLKQLWQQQKDFLNNNIDR